MQDLSRSAGVQEFGMKYYWLKLCLLCYGMPGISAQNLSRHPPKSFLNSRNSKIRLENSSNISGKKLGRDFGGASGIVCKIVGSCVLAK